MDRTRPSILSHVSRISLLGKLLHIQIIVERQALVIVGIHGDLGQVRGRGEQLHLDAPSRHRIVGDGEARPAQQQSRQRERAHCSDGMQESRLPRKGDGGARWGWSVVGSAGEADDGRVERLLATCTWLAGGYCTASHLFPLGRLPDTVTRTSAPGEINVYELCKNCIAQNPLTSHNLIS